ncbi:unnamed protein product [Laminaria digitata]
MGDSITEGTVVQWMKNTGEPVEADEVVVVLETDKVSIDVRSPSAGTLVEQMAGEGDNVEVGTALMKIDTSGTGAAPAPKPVEAPKKESAAAAPVAAAPPAPAPARAPAPPTPTPAPRAPAAGQKVALPPIMPSANGDRTESRVKMTRMRMRIAERLKSAQNTAAMLTTFQEVSLTWRKPSPSTDKRPRRGRWRLRTWREGLSRSQTEACLGLSWERPSSTPPSRPFSACTPPR